MCQGCFWQKFSCVPGWKGGNSSLMLCVSGNSYGKGEPSGQVLKRSCGLPIPKRESLAAQAACCVPRGMCPEVEASGKCCLHPKNVIGLQSCGIPSWLRSYSGRLLEWDGGYWNLDSFTAVVSKPGLWWEQQHLRTWAEVKGSRQKRAFQFLVGCLVEYPIK